MKKLIILSILFGVHFFCCSSLQAKEGIDKAPVTLSISSPSNRYEGAGFDQHGHLIPDEIPLEIKLVNSSDSNFTLLRECEIVLEVSAQNSGNENMKTYRLPGPEVVIEPGERYQGNLEVGEFLTTIAGGFMKGDSVTIKIRLVGYDPYHSMIIESNSLLISIFVPEG